MIRNDSVITLNENFSINKLIRFMESFLVFHAHTRLIWFYNLTFHLFVTQTYLIALENIKMKIETLYL